jgi:iron complex outermembrane receptor protein
MRPPSRRGRIWRARFLGSSRPTADAVFDDSNDPIRDHRLAATFNVQRSKFLDAHSVSHALQRREALPGVFAIVNAELPVRSWGTELILRYRRGGLMLIATHSYTSSSEDDPEAPGNRRDVPLTPRHVASFNAIWEDEARGRIGVEAYYIGRQPTDENPYRTEGAAHVLIGALAEKRLGRARVFLNLENVGNVRQTRFDPLLLPARAADGRWTVDTWAPLDGFVANGGVRVAF